MYRHQSLYFLWKRRKDMRMMLTGAGAVGECILKMLEKRDPKGEWLSYVLLADFD